MDQRDHTWPNSCKSSFKITFSFYKIFCWKFRKYIRRLYRTSVNFVRLKICTVICNYRLIFQFFSKFVLKWRYQTGFTVFCYVYQIFRKIFCKLKKLSYMNELMYNLVTWLDWSMASMYFSLRTDNCWVSYFLLCNFAKKATRYRYTY